MTYEPPIPEKKIDLVEDGRRGRHNSAAVYLERDLQFSTAALESYAFARWEPVVYDAMAVAAMVEYADRTLHRPSHGWARRLNLRIPVHDAARWNDSSVSNALHDAIGFLTGDFWSIEFVDRRRPAPSPKSPYLNLSRKVDAVIAFSNGMDSRAIAGLLGEALGDKLLLVRVAKKASRRLVRKKDGVIPFTAVPYTIAMPRINKESSARSRGFKFALISGLAAYLCNAGKVVIPESGQGALGPAVIPVGHAYPDYRNHPLFTVKMELFLSALLRMSVRFEFPRLWNTKGETLRDYVALSKSNADWMNTRSCWRNSQWSSVNGRLRQCGVCAACMLRRMSVHAAGLSEPVQFYVCGDLRAKTLRSAVDPNFGRWSNASAQYALAGILHLDHLADLSSADGLPTVRRHALLLAPALSMAPTDVEDRLKSLFGKHAKEWKAYVQSLGERSFVREWTRV